MKTIWKYPIGSDHNGEFALRIPQGATILSVQTQQGSPQMWALVDDEEPKVERRFRFYGTGHEISGGRMMFLGTFQVDGGRFVFHLFELAGDS